MANECNYCDSKNESETMREITIILLVLVEWTNPPAINIMKRDTGQVNIFAEMVVLSLFMETNHAMVIKLWAQVVCLFC